MCCVKEIADICSLFVLTSVIKVAPVFYVSVHFNWKFAYLTFYLLIFFQVHSAILHLARVIMQSEESFRVDLLLFFLKQRTSHSDSTL